MGDRKAVIKNADMGEEMQQDAVDCATQALEKYNIEKTCVRRAFRIVECWFVIDRTNLNPAEVPRRHGVWVVTMLHRVDHV
ncbi:AGAP001335-PA-like protein [Anopheles sinensis]|uniref:AGAP001335-PA-like protein n=1 Tax=Anopheles sinensis TaxID=74873 RepID=A0A084VS62_ANOSI|nr:AGAP001335-PA-like protein [Anopheles sinensis]